MPNQLPTVALIIDDIGYDNLNSRAAIQLPQPFAVAILPFSPHAKSLAALANQLGKDVILHLPLEADKDNHLLGPGALYLDMSQVEIGDGFLDALAAVPYAIGINNHMGSRFTRDETHTRWLMRAIHDQGDLFFIDSRTTQSSIASQQAQIANIASVSRDVFIDNVQTKSYIEGQLEKLLADAKSKGHALGIAHPHLITIALLNDWQPSKSGVRLVALREYIDSYKNTAARASKATGSLALTTPECGDQRSNAEPTENPNAQR